MYYDPVQEVIGMAHAGWRGTARGVAAATVEAMSEQFGSRPGDIYAGLGPSIGFCCYEVSEEVQRLFYGRQHFPDLPTAEKYRNLVRESAVFIRKQGSEQARPHLDLWETNRNQLLMAGLLPEHIELPGICTSCEKERFFSHRGECGKTGRFPSILALRKDR
jgi:YfiH family protein